MRIAELSIKRPVFITCLVILLLAVGYISLKKIPVNLFPDVTFPVVVVQTTYPGAGPEEVEKQISKILEEQISNIPGLKKLSSQNGNAISSVVAEFTNETDIKYAEQQVRDRVANAKPRLPREIDDPTIRTMDPADQAILIIALKSKLSPVTLYDIADKKIKPMLEQVPQVSMVDIMGGRKREIHVDLDRQKLTSHEISVTNVSNRIATAGQNVPIGNVDQGAREKIFRTFGDFKSIGDIGSTVVSFTGNDVPVTINDLGKVYDSQSDRKSRTYLNGDNALIMMVFRQSKANTIAVVDDVIKRIDKINKDLKVENLAVELSVVRDGSKMIRDNVDDVEESIFIGIILTVVVVYLFLGSGRSTFITGLALPTSLIGSFLLMHLAGFSINTMSLLALSLAVGLLIDDAIVVRENIFRYQEKGTDLVKAAILGTKEVLLAVIAASMTVIAVFGPIGFLKGVVGGFFKEFGLTVCFAMIISLFDAITVAPMLSAYFGGPRTQKKTGLWNKISLPVLQGFNRFQNKLEDLYETILHFTLRFPILTLIAATLIFAASIFAAKYVPKTFVPAADTGEFIVSLQLPPGSNLQAMTEISQKIDKQIRSNHEVKTSVGIIGGRSGEANSSMFFINLVPKKERASTTTEFKEKLRKQLKAFPQAKPIVKDVDHVGGGLRPFNLNITGNNSEELTKIANNMFEILKKHPALTDPEINSKPGKPELQFSIDKTKAAQMGISATTVGNELRAQIEGLTPAVFRDKGEEYDIRVRLQEDQRDLEKNFASTLVPNVNDTLVRLSDVATPIATHEPSTITRENRSRYIQISADIAPKGPGMGGVMTDIDKIFHSTLKLPQGISYNFAGQAESFTELQQNMTIAVCLGILFIYLVLASLYESFIIPLTIMLVLPLATCGALFALAITQHSLDIFSMIGCILLFGIATKNSILLVDYTKQLVEQGMSRRDAIIKAGRTRLRPILMTTIALIAGMLPIAIGLNEASSQRTSMGVAVIGGLVSSTLLTLVVVPAAYSYIDRFREWIKRRLKRAIGRENNSPMVEDIPENLQQET